MKNILILSCLPVFLLLFFRDTKAQNVSFKPSAESVTGEVIDLNIYMSEGGHGATVQHWAQEGINHGDPVALLADDGESYFFYPTRCVRTPIFKSGECPVSMCLLRDRFICAGILSVWMCSHSIRSSGEVLRQYLSFSLY